MGGKTKSIPTRMMGNLVGILFVSPRPPYNTIMHYDNFNSVIVNSPLKTISGLLRIAYPIIVLRKYCSTAEMRNTLNLFITHDTTVL